MADYDCSVSSRKGCNYCNARKPLPLDAEFVSFGIDGSYLSFKNNGRVVKAVEINYCPVCGKKINK